MALTLTIPGDQAQLTGNPIWVKASGGSPPAGSSGYKYLLQIISTDGLLTFDGIPDAIAPDSANEAWFNVSGKVDQPQKAVFQYPPSGPSVAYSNKVYSVQYQVGECYWDDTGEYVENWGSTTSDYELVKGGASQRQIALWNDNSSNFYQTYLVNGRFLTHRPWGDYVHYHQPVKLWFMVATGKSAALKITSYYANGNTASYSSASIAMNVTSLYEFNCNPYYLGIPLTNNGSAIQYFDVVLNNGSDISDSRRFEFDSRYCERPFYILFKNSIGGVDDVFFSGIATEDFDLKGNEMQLPPLRNATVFEPTIIQPDTQGRNIWQLNTGIKSITQMLHLRDMLVSRQVWLLYPNLNITNYSVIPVVFSTGTKKLVNHLENIHDLTITVKEAHTSPFSFDNRLV